MKKIEGFDQALTATGEFETLALGGHVCIIKKVVVEQTDKGKEIMKIGFDIAEGENKDFYKRQFEKRKEFNFAAKWGGMYNQLTEGKSLPFFKGLLKNIEDSNSGYKWNWDEKTLVGKLFGGVFGEEEYLSNDGEVKKATKCVQIRNVEQIRKGVEVPPLKKLPSSVTGNDEAYSLSDVSDDVIPF